MWRCWSVVVALCLAASSAEDELPWWRTAVLYQVYPRSFKDSNGDGIGDLKGIIEKADYLKELGVTAVWLSPILDSPMVDFGYDISDFRAISPLFGTIDDYKELRQKLNDLDIKLLMDMVPNHSSDQHQWFQKSIQKEAPYTDFYVWHDGTVDNSTGRRVPPNNWVSAFSGSAWTWNEQRQQFYLHQFDEKQPDLNYRNPAVVQQMEDVFTYWMKMGVDGFRVDAVPYLYEDAQLRDEPMDEGRLDHIYTQNQPETYALLRHWADSVLNFSQADNTSRALFLEAYANEADTLKYYGEGPLAFMQPFDFQLVDWADQDTRPGRLGDMILSWLRNIPQGASTTWVVGNHDNHRAANRYGPEMVDGLALLTGVLPGVMVVYNGDELGMEDTHLRWDQTVDPAGLKLGPDHYLQGTRDPERTPMQWDDSTSGGFSTNVTTWLPVNPNYWWLNVEAQRAAPVSHLKVFQAIIRARRDPVLQLGDLKVSVPDNDTLVVARSYNSSWYALVINMGSYEVQYDVPALVSQLDFGGDMSVAVASGNNGLSAGVYMEVPARLALRPKAALLLKSGLSGTMYSAATFVSMSSIVTLAAAVGHLWSYFLF